MVSIFEGDQDPGSAIRANTSGKWAFVYLTDSEAIDNRDLLDAEVEPLTAEELAKPPKARMKPRVLSRRKLIIDLDALNIVGPQVLTEYSPRAGGKAAKITSAQLAKKDHE